MTQDCPPLVVNQFFFCITKFGTQERGNANLGTRKKSFDKARGNAEREEEMKERGHASREGPAGTRAQLWKNPLLHYNLFVGKCLEYMISLWWSRLRL